VVSLPVANGSGSHPVCRRGGVVLLAGTNPHFGREAERRRRQGVATRGRGSGGGGRGAGRGVRARWSRMRRMTAGCVMKLTTRIVLAQRGHSKGSTS
jgi:hypothetical protein